MNGLDFLRGQRSRDDVAADDATGSVAGARTGPPPKSSSPTATTVTAAVTLGTIIAMLPVFLLGGLASLMRAELAFHEATLGLLAGSFFAASAVLSIPAGRFAERVGARRGLLLGLGLGGASLAGIAGLATSSWGLAAALLVAGAGNSLVQPSANLALARGVAVHRQGIAFGVKQAAIPSATFLAGLSVPLVGLTAGWRWAFGGGAVAAIVVQALARRWIPTGPAAQPVRERPRSSARARAPSNARGLVVAAIAGGCGGAAANSLGAFYVESTIASGRAIGVAGVLLSFGSLAGLATRLVSGWAADRVGTDQLRVVAALLAVGAGSYVALGRGLPLGWFACATALAFMAGWGWPGLLHLSIVREHPAAPARASGVLQTGLYTGGVLGPVAFGWIVRSSGYPSAWGAAAGIAALGSLMLWVARRPVRLAPPRRG